jgi:hypothetical protein
MDISPFTKIVFLLLLGSLLLMTGCTTAQPFWKTGPSYSGAWWQGKPYSQMTPAERQEQDPTFWKMYGHLHGLGE